MQAYRQKTYALETDTSRNRQKKKFDALQKAKSNHQSRELNVQRNRWVVNRSSRVLSELETDVLSKGLNFALIPWKIPIPEIVSVIETALRSISHESAQRIRLLLVGLLSKAKPPPYDMSREEMSIVKSLKRDKSIIIVPADKGCATVLLDRQKYDEKLLHLLSDETTYTKLKRDPAPSLERKMNALLPRVLYLRLRSSAGQTPRL